MPELNPHKFGVKAVCFLCQNTKIPRGRSVPLGLYGCDDRCEGYDQLPYVGSLWPDESEETFGYPVADAGTEIR